MDALKIIIPVLVAIFTAIAGIVAYLVQKKADRKNELIKLRQDKYQTLLDSFQNHIANETKESHTQYQKAVLSLFVVASDKVLVAVGNLQSYLADTSTTNQFRDMTKVGELFAVALKEMRKDCFEESNLSNPQMLEILPFEGIQSESTIDEYSTKSKWMVEKRLTQDKNNTIISHDEEKEMVSSDSGVQAIEKRMIEAHKNIIHNYEELVRVGNQPGRNTANIAFITYIAKSLSTLPDEQIELLRSEGILTI